MSYNMEYRPLSHTDDVDDSSPEDGLLTDARKSRLDADPSTHHHSQSRWHALLPRSALVLSLLASAAALSAHTLQTGPTVPGPSIVSVKDLAALRTPSAYPNYDRYVLRLARAEDAPGIVFPGTIVRADRASPDEFFDAGPSVHIGTSASTFFEFQLARGYHDHCYLAALVPSPADLAASPKSTSLRTSGDISQLRIYNVTRLTHAQRARLSWGTRPTRFGELGRVNFTHVDASDEWRLRAPTPAFPCAKNGVYTLEVTCDDCELEFDETFVLPPLGFEVGMLA